MMTPSVYNAPPTALARPAPVRPNELANTITPVIETTALAALIAHSCLIWPATFSAVAATSVGGTTTWRLFRF